VGISRLRQGNVMCEFPDCENSATFLLGNDFITPGRNSLFAYCERHFGFDLDCPPALPDRLSLASQIEPKRPARRIKSYFAKPL